MRLLRWSPVRSARTVPATSTPTTAG